MLQGTILHMFREGNYKVVLSTAIQSLDTELMRRAEMILAVATMVLGIYPTLRVGHTWQVLGEDSFYPLEFIRIERFQLPLRFS